MAIDLLAAQRGAAIALGASVALLAGACLARSWLCASGSGWGAARSRLLGRLAAGAAALALLAHVAALWLEAASMAGVPVGEAASAVGLVLGSTHYGMAWSIGAVALLVAAVAATRAARSSARVLLAFVPLAVFWYAQAMTSHAANEGDMRLFVAVYAVHIALASVWVGDVLAGAAVLAGPVPDEARGARAAYLRALSGSATIALAGIFVTGLYLAWQLVGSFANLFGDPYGNTLLAKLALVGLAALLGAVNRFRMMPPLLAHGTSGVAPLRFLRVLRVEAVVLLAVLVAAAILGSSLPPGMGS